MIHSRTIERKRDGLTLDSQEIFSFFRGYHAGEVEEYQMSAFLMAVVFRGLAAEELDALLQVMIHTGETLDLGHLPGPRVDKHSTGGVGDKVSLILAPLAAELGLFVPMMSGRGLGHTGGTLDKLEAIPGFRTDLDLKRFAQVVEEVGYGMIGQTAEIAPIDRRSYALRSVTGTVPCIPLIAASILSKKLAEDLQGLVLDVKLGDGAFIPDRERSNELARTMVDLGNARGVRTLALQTAMDRPLGSAIGHALEVDESVAVLQGGGPDELRELVIVEAVAMAEVGFGVSGDALEGYRARAEVALDGGQAYERFLRNVEAQGGDPRAVDGEGPLDPAPVIQDVRADQSGTVLEVAPRQLGVALAGLGGGRAKLGDDIDVRVGFEILVGPGDQVRAGDLIGRVHLDSEGRADEAIQAVSTAIDIGEGEADMLPLVVGRIS